MIFWLLDKLKFKTSPEVIKHYVERGDLALNNKLFSVAFGHYMQAESMAPEKYYSKSSQMAINGQLNESETQRLLEVLRGEYLANKARASLHYGLVCNYLQQYEEAGEAYKKALSLGIKEASGLLDQVIQIKQTNS
jgi:tetratricopeptide (TPR) repeat protein